MNVLLPYARKHNPNYSRPVSMLEAERGTTIAEFVCKDIMSLSELDLVRLIGRASDDQLDVVVRLFRKFLGATTVNSLQLHKETGGAACTCLLALEDIDWDQPVLIMNSDQTFFGELGQPIDELERSGCDAGVLTTTLLHPRWSYVLRDDDRSVIQICEKNVVSDEAIAGVYYFKSVEVFVTAACSMISQRNKVLDSYFIGPCLNQIMLSGGYVEAIPLEKNNIQFKSFAI